MLTRQHTLSQNVGIYASLAVLLLVHGWFWGSWLRGARAGQAQIVKDVAKLKQDVVRLNGEAANVKKELEDTKAQLQRRSDELNELGNFLPGLDMKTQNLRTILNMIEGLGIKITKTEFPPPEAPASGGGYVTVDFTLELQGPYKAFKQLLAKVQQADMIIRISSWELKDTGRENPLYEWRVLIKFETYFEVAPQGHS
jgi:hypothetical protein